MNLRLFRRPLAEVAAVSETGLVRADNQDAFFLAADHSLICVADGMGGGQGGAVASRIVCKAVAMAEGVRDFAGRVEAVNAAIVLAHRQIREYARGQGFAQMGSTVALVLRDLADPSRGAVAWVGDSRVYRRRRRKLEQLTADHRLSPYSHFLVRAISGDERMRAEWRETDFLAGDVYLVCTDGVSDMLGDDSINGVLAQGGDARAMAERLSAAVRREGARDNYTAVVEQVEK